MGRRPASCSGCVAANLRLLLSLSCLFVLIAELFRVGTWSVTPLSSLIAGIVFTVTAFLLIRPARREITWEEFFFSSGPRRTNTPWYLNDISALTFGAIGLLLLVNTLALWLFGKPILPTSQEIPALIIAVALSIVWCPMKAIVRGVQSRKSKSPFAASRVVTARGRTYTVAEVPSRFQGQMDRLDGLPNSPDGTEQKVAVYEDILRTASRHREPQFWALVQNNLGNAYFLRTRGDRASNIEKASRLRELR